MLTFRSTTRFTVVLGVCLFGAVLTGCSTAPPPQKAPETIAPPPSEPDTGETRAVKQAYKEFWKVSHRLDQLPPQQWRPALDKVATEPLLTRLLENTRAQREQGIEIYGHVTARITDVRVDGDRATVTDCQNASRSGQADAATGDRKTVGVARNPVTGTLTRDAGGRWHVKHIEYPGGRC